MEERKQPETRARYRHFQVIPTRWKDNDVYGHVNNVEYYSYFDTVINRYLIDAGGLNPQADTIVGIAVETMCRFQRSFSYPEDVQAVFPGIVAHRLEPASGSALETHGSLGPAILDAVPVP